MNKTASVKTIQTQDSYLTKLVAQLAERSLPTLEIRSSNPNNGKKIYNTILSIGCYLENSK